MADPQDANLHVDQGVQISTPSEAASIEAAGAIGALFVLPVDHQAPAEKRSGGGDPVEIVPSIPSLLQPRFTETEFGGQPDLTYPVFKRARFDLIQYVGPFKDLGLVKAELRGFAADAFDSVPWNGANNVRYFSRGPHLAKQFDFSAPPRLQWTELSLATEVVPSRADGRGSTIFEKLHRLREWHTRCSANSTIFDFCPVVSWGGGSDRASPKSDGRFGARGP